MKQPKASFTKLLKDHCFFPVSPWCSLDGLSHPIMAVINLILLDIKIVLCTYEWLKAVATPSCLSYGKYRDARVLTGTFTLNFLLCYLRYNRILIYIM